MHVFQTKPEIAVHCIAKPILIILELAIETCLEVFSAHKQRPANGVILEVTWHLDGPPSLRHPIALQAGIRQSGGTYSSSGVHASCCVFNTLRPKQDGRHFPDDIFKCIFVNESVWISRKISLKFVPKVRINNIPALVQIMAWRRPGDKPLSEPMMVSLLMHICVTWPQWVKELVTFWKISHLKNYILMG